MKELLRSASCFLVQTFLFLGALAVSWLVHGVLHLNLWLGFLGGLFVFVLAWIGYGFYQAKRPDWWPPWDEGLPQSSRMLNAFVPAFLVFAAVSILIPVFGKARELKKHQQEMRMKSKSLSVPKV